jgi:polyisoprenoid-binding protein YceI
MNQGMKQGITRGSAIFMIVALVQCAVAAASASTWNVDQSHTTVGFTISHLFTSVQGRFDEFEGSITFDPDAPKSTAVSATVVASSINTNNAKRDKHLRSADFFDVEKFPELTFTSTGVANWSGKGGELRGDLTIHGVTKPVVFKIKYLGEGKDPWGNVRAGFSGSLTINRKDYGLAWNQALETGGYLVGEEVEIRIDVEGLLAE